MKIDLNLTKRFESRHIGPEDKSIEKMLHAVGANSMEELISQTVPASIRLDHPLELPNAVSEYDFLKQFEKLAKKNKVYHSFIGMGYYNTITPPVIQRNILENPGWYTAYTPYQAEIAQGRLEALVNFQTMVMDLTGMEIANASLLDEGTAAAEAMAMLHSLRKGDKKAANKFFVDENVFPQTRDVLEGRAKSLGIELEIGEVEKKDWTVPGFFGMLLQYPNSNGSVEDCEPVIGKAREAGVLTAVSADLLSLTLLKPPGEMGVDVAVGTTQRFGVPMGYGGPHAAYFATKEEYKRNIPGRIIGVSIDKNGNKAYRMALQTREQHIRREKANSNICTAQVLLAVMAGMYAVYHGPEGLQDIAARIHGLATLLEQQLEMLGFRQINKLYFDTLKIEVPDTNMKEQIRALAEGQEVNFRYFDHNYIGISLDETHNLEDVQLILQVLAKAKNAQISSGLDTTIEFNYPPHIARKSGFMEHPVFNKFHSEHEMLRYLKRLENKDLSLAHSMISLGSCTMKLNATAEMIPITWKELANIHPFAPAGQAWAIRKYFKTWKNGWRQSLGFRLFRYSPTLEPKENTPA